jgi:hypothetical protein
MIFEVLLAENVYDVTSYNVVQGYQSFRGSCCPNCEGRIKEAARPYGMSEYMYQSAWCHIPEDNNLQILHDYFVNGSYYSVLHESIFSEQWNGKDMEVTGYGLIGVSDIIIMIIFYSRSCLKSMNRE